MRRSLLIWLLVLPTIGAIFGCGGSKPITRVIRSEAPPPPPDTTSPLVDDLDYVEVNTDTRINPVMTLRYNMLSDGGYAMDVVSDSVLGCRFSIPRNWAGTRRQYENLINFFGNEKISVTISVAYRTFDSTGIWAQVQEALSFGKNQLPRGDWRLDSLFEAQRGWRQSYFGRYNFNDRQYNMGFFEQDSLQYNVIIYHPLGSLTEGEAQAINYILATFAYLKYPTIKIPLPVGNIGAPPQTAKEDEDKSKKKKSKAKGKTKSKK
ncbi:MAG: hypothetical protein NZM06_03610 [Chloroherpetonaceae bacterium]|nr:hypothetical protein [Chloroherpetonaceae bacterium]MDW8437064.1 hypothetical protein [Chloroherpetonaceae bacterium]